MASETAIFGLRFPQHDDSPPAVHTYVQHLAEDVDKQLAAQMRSADVNYVAAEQSSPSPDAVALGTPDRVTLEVPDMGNGRGLVALAFRALWKVSSPSVGAFAELYVNDAALAAPQSGGAPSTSAPIAQRNATKYGPLSSYVGGLISNNTGSADSTLLTSGPQIVSSGGVGGGLCVFEADEGEAVIEVRYQVAGGGNVYAKNRLLAAYTLPTAVPAP